MHRKVRFIRRSRASYFAALPQNLRTFTDDHRQGNENLSVFVPRWRMVTELRKKYYGAVIMHKTNDTFKRLRAVMKDVNGDHRQIIKTMQDQIDYLMEFIEIQGEILEEKTGIK